MTKLRQREQLWVWLDDPAFGSLQHIGTLSQGSRGSISFAYNAEWLSHAHAFMLDPELDLLPGEFYPGRSNFGVFMDSCPDRWGQMLMKRREAIAARDEDRRPITLGPWEFLLGVQDCTRMGALRYSFPEHNIFMADEVLAAPPVTRIAELQAIAFELTRKKLAAPDKIREWLKVLVAPGASLGGARPKANIVDEQGHLWVAKFPSADDDYDVAAWEKVLHNLARDCGITVPESQLLQLDGRYHTFIVKRFDRDREKRHFFTSAMTMLQHIDTDDASYLELAEFLATFADPESLQGDLEELFTRVVFNIVTANRDDHLRNHGFLRSPAGWKLAPAYDMNPSFKKEDHALALDFDNNQPNLDIVLDTAGYYRLEKKKAKRIIQKVCNTVTGWEKCAKNYGLSRQDCLEAKHLFLL